MSTKSAATSNTLTVVTNSLNPPPPKRKFKLSKPFDPARPGTTKLNVNHVVVTNTAGNDVPTPASLADIKFAYTDVVFHVLDFQYVGNTKKTLIIWFYGVSTARVTNPPRTSIKDLVVTINSTDEGVDADVDTEAP